MKDDCPEVAETAQEVFNACFLHAERNAMKKQLVINTLSFEVHTEVYDGYGDMEMADCRFTIDRKSRVLTMTDFHTGGMEQSVTLEGGQMAKLLRYIVHTLEIFMWEQDYSMRPDAEDYDPFLDGEEGFFMEDLEDRLEIQPPKEPEGSPSWRCRWSTRTIQSRIFAVMRITCQTVQKNCIFPCWNILSRRMRSFNGKSGVWFSYVVLFYCRQWGVMKHCHKKAVENALKSRNLTTF